MKKQDIMADARKVLTKDDYAISMSTLMLKDIQKALELVDRRQINRMLDLGCGLGGMARLVANFISAKEVYGVDISPDVLRVAEGRGLQTVRADLEVDKLPLPSNYFDFVMSLGVIEHLRFYDNLISESYRLVNEGGYFFLSWPNLGNYTQRIALLLGYQPNEIEISNKVRVGTIYDSGGEVTASGGHIHAATLRAVRQLLEYYGFTIVEIKRGNPRLIREYSRWSPIITFFGRICPVSLSRRLIIIAKK